MHTIEAINKNRFNQDSSVLMFFYCLEALFDTPYYGSAYYLQFSKRHGWWRISL